jgi:S-methylmethionine-dependent homocysteine/selenocysteine methylase
MSKYRHSLPQHRGGHFLADGGMETTLIFYRGIELPHFASFVLLGSLEGRRVLQSYYEPYLAIARKYDVGFVLDSPTWRANSDWGAKLGYDGDALRDVNVAAIEFLEDVRQRWETSTMPCVINGAIGPRGDGYQASSMTASDAEEYHRPQISAFAETRADMVTAYTIANVAEAIGIAQAAKAFEMPCAISFTVETDGRLAGVGSLRDAIEATDNATRSCPEYYLINCAHPAHFDRILAADGGTWVTRIHGIRANASTRSHAELDESENLDSGDPGDLAQRYRSLQLAMPMLHIFGGCCGTDHRHVEAIGMTCLPPKDRVEYSLRGGSTTGLRPLGEIGDGDAGLNSGAVSICPSTGA